MAQDHVAEPFARRRRESVRDARRYYAGMFVLGLVILAATVAPTVWGWWQTAVPAAIGSVPGSSPVGVPSRWMTLPPTIVAE